MRAQHVPSPTNALIVGMIIALRVIANLVQIFKAQGIMVVICLRICRESVSEIVGQIRGPALQAWRGTSLSLAVAVFLLSPSTTINGCAVFGTEIKIFALRA